MLPNYYRSHLDSMAKNLRAFPWHDRYAYGMYIAQTYYYVCHSVRLLATAAGRMTMEDNSSHKRFLTHIREESGHEVMARRDLEELGYTLEDFPELPETRMFWETQYYKIEHIDPLSLMGYILALEAVACEQCPWITQELKKSFPNNAHTFMRVHGEEDPDHVTKAWEQISALPPARLKAVVENFEQTAVGLNNILNGVMRRTVEKVSVAA